VSTDLHRLVNEFRSLLERGETLLAIERFYAPDVCIFDNRTLARAGRDACLAYEREQLAGQTEPPRFRFQSMAINEADGVVFLEYILRFTGADSRPMRLEQVSVQHWRRGLIMGERLYYEGVIDEGDE